MKRKFLLFIANSFIFGMLFLVLVTPMHAAARDITPDSIVKVVNETRVQNGLPQLIMNETLSQAAYNKAVDMQTYGYWSHTNPVTTATGWSFIQATGYAYTNAGENLAKDYISVQGVLRGWLTSPTHRSVLLSSKYSQTGIGVLYYTQNGVEKALVVQLFASPYQQQTTVISSSLTVAFERFLASILL